MDVLSKEARVERDIREENTHMDATTVYDEHGDPVASPSDLERLAYVLHLDEVVNAKSMGKKSAYPVTNTPTPETFVAPETTPDLSVDEMRERLRALADKLRP
jgi:hypothetical protein